MTKFEVGETYKTRGGKEAELVHAYYYEGDGRLVWVLRGEGEPQVQQTLSDGCMSSDANTKWDIMPPKRSGVVYVYEGNYGFWSSKLSPEKFHVSRPKLVAILPWEEGDGLDD